MKELNIKALVKLINSSPENKEKEISYINNMKKLIDKGEIDEYTINTFSTLCGTAIEFLILSEEQKDKDKQKQYLKMMEDVYKLEKVDEFKINDEIINESNELNINYNKDNNENKIETNLIEDNKIEIENKDKNEIIIKEMKDKN